jgi:hypothetical protein
MSTLFAEAPQSLSEAGVVVANPSPAFGDHSLSSRQASLRLAVPSEIADARWFRPAVEQLGALLTLPPNWDSYGGRATAQASASQTISFLAQTLSAQVAPPWVVPLHDGGVQLEWHRGGVDVEVVLSPEEGDHLYVSDLADGDEWEGALDGAGVARLHAVLDRLTTP